MLDASPSSSSQTIQTQQQQHSSPNNNHNPNHEQNHKQIEIHHPLALSRSTPPSTIRKARRAIRHSAFFNRLPPEIRDAVYAHLFDFTSFDGGYGGVKLVYLYEEEEEEETGTGCEGWRAEVGKFFWREGEESESRKGWRFEGCVCGSTQDGERGWWKERTCVSVREAAVLKGGERWVAPSGRSGRCVCRVGILGWMLSCRMAYTDSLRPLYARNAFTLVNLTPPSLASLLPSSLLPPSHLSLITSLLISFVAFPTRAEYTLLATKLPSCFPNLRHLRIGVFRPFPCALGNDHAPLLKLLKTIVRRLGRQLEYCELVVPSRIMFYWVRGKEYAVRPAPNVGAERDGGQ